TVKKEELDAEFELKFGHQSEEKKDVLMREALRKYQFSASRIDAITRHVVTHFKEKIRKDNHKALLVCDGRFAAVRYKQAFENLKDEGFHDFETRVVVSVGSPKSDRIARDYYETLEWNRMHP